MIPTLAGFRLLPIDLLKVTAEKLRWSQQVSHPYLTIDTISHDNCPDEFVAFRACGFYNQSFSVVNIIRYLMTKFGSIISIY